MEQESGENMNDVFVAVSPVNSETELLILKETLLPFNGNVISTRYDFLQKNEVLALFSNENGTPKVEGYEIRILPRDVIPKSLSSNPLDYPRPVRNESRQELPKEHLSTMESSTELPKSSLSTEPLPPAALTTETLHGNIKPVDKVVHPPKMGFLDSTSSLLQTRASQIRRYKELPKKDVFNIFRSLTLNFYLSTFFVTTTILNHILFN